MESFHVVDLTSFVPCSFPAYIFEEVISKQFDLYIYNLQKFFKYPRSFSFTSALYKLLVIRIGWNKALIEPGMKIKKGLLRISLQVLNHTLTRTQTPVNAHKSNATSPGDKEKINKSPGDKEKTNKSHAEEEIGRESSTAYHEFIFAALFSGCLFKLIRRSIPPEIIDTHELQAITLDYIRECQHDNIVDSLSSLEPLDNPTLSELTYSNGSSVPK
ncbi:oleoyl-acyl carrier protein thioesterase [Artemisia annua]|uniref:Oleoyl-acyl carrier protein thioesterase n=1 Tax=Artemisia annua TaxID=35608 RepID=A0A2U1M1R2_ARTAN|nr:oleoyl-acyl carrier protein thioesterase [Artemisia annua]